MSVEIIKGDMVESLKKGGLDAYAHQCNTFCRMGRGIAPLLAKEVFGLREVDNKTQVGDRDKMGTFTKASHNNGSVVYNVYGQYHWGDYQVVRGRNTDYDALYKGLTSVKEDMIVLGGKTLGLPLIGCGLAGGNWEGVVLPMIKEIFGGSDIDIIIFKL